MPPIKPLFRPPTIFFLLFVLAIFVHFILPTRKIILFPYNLTGILLLFLGILISFWGNRTFKKHKVALIPGSKSTKIVKDGPFTFTRNPMYLGMMLFSIGIAFLMGSLVFLLFPILLFFYLNFFMIPFEESLLKQTFRNSYENYKRRVRRWF